MTKKNNPDCDCRNRVDERCPTCEQENLERGIEFAMLRAELELEQQANITKLVMRRAQR